MPPSRRDFINFVVAGSVAGGCPIDETLLAAPETNSPAGPPVHGEHFEKSWWKKRWQPLLNNAAPGA